jgi:WD40 repeat protein
MPTGCLPWQAVSAAVISFLSMEQSGMFPFVHNNQRRVPLVVALVVGSISLTTFARLAAESPDAAGWKEFLSLEIKAKVWSVTFSPDNKVVATGSGGYLGTPGELKLWEAATGRELASASEKRSIRWVAFSPDGKLLATAEHDDTAKLRDPRTGEVLRVLKGHESGLDSVAFSPDGKTIATSCWDKTVKLWDTTTGETLTTFRGHAKEVYNVAFSPDGQSIASGGHDGAVIIWDVKTAEQRRVLFAHQDVMHCLAYSPDGKRLASVSWDKTVKVWNAQTGKLEATLEGHSAQVLAVSFSPDGKTLASVSGRWGDGNRAPGPGEIKLWDVASQKEIAQLTGHTDRVFSVAFSPDGKTLATGSWDGTVKLWRRGE